MNFKRPVWSIHRRVKRLLRYTIKDLNKWRIHCIVDFKGIHSWMAGPQRLGECHACDLVLLANGEWTTDTWSGLGTTQSDCWMKKSQTERIPACNYWYQILEKWHPSLMPASSSAVIWGWGAEERSVTELHGALGRLCFCLDCGGDILMYLGYCIAHDTWEQLIGCRWHLNTAYKWELTVLRGNTAREGMAGGACPSGVACRGHPWAAWELGQGGAAEFSSQVPAVPFGQGSWTQMCTAIVYRMGLAIPMPWIRSQLGQRHQYPFLHSCEFSSVGWGLCWDTSQHLRPRNRFWVPLWSTCEEPHPAPCL